MTREEMLNRMGLTSEEFKDLMLKLAQLRAALNDRQRAVLDRSLPTHSTAAKTFGADVTAGDLQKLLKAEQEGGFAGAAVATQVQNP
jgi:hypothetical protein